MARKTVLILSAVGISSLLLVAGPAWGVVNPPVLTGLVTCNATSGVWSGTIRFTPPLFNGGTASTETVAITAGLGNSASPCITTSGTVEAGKLVGKIQVNDAGTANNCATWFSGAALPAPVAGSQIKMTWGNPPGAPTLWKQPSNFNIKGAVGLNKITIKNGTVTGSFTPFANPKAVLSDAGWPTTIATACASTTGLSSLTLGTSSGKW